MLVLDGDVLPERKHRNDRSIDQAHTSVICARRLSDVGTNGSNPVHSGVILTVSNMAMSGASFVPIHATTLYGSSGWTEAAVVLRKIIRAPDKERETQAHPAATVPVDKGKTPLAVHSAQTRIRIEFWRG